MLDRHEGRSGAHDHPLGVREELVQGLLAVAFDLYLDADFVHGLGAEAVLAQLGEKPVAIRDPGSFDLNGVAHGAILPQPQAWKRR